MISAVLLKKIVFYLALFSAVMEVFLSTSLHDVFTQVDREISSPLEVKVSRFLSQRILQLVGDYTGH